MFFWLLIIYTNHVCIFHLVTHWEENFVGIFYFSFYSRVPRISIVSKHFFLLSIYMMFCTCSSDQQLLVLVLSWLMILYFILCKPAFEHKKTEFARWIEQTARRRGERESKRRNVCFFYLIISRFDCVILFSCRCVSIQLDLIVNFRLKDRFTSFLDGHFNGQFLQAVHIVLACQTLFSHLLH